MTLALRTATDAVCLLAREEGASPRVLLAMPYATTALPTPATLTFVAGPSFVGPAEITARGVLGGSFVGGATIVTTLSMPGTSEATLPIERCRARGTAGFGTRPGGTFAALHSPQPRVIAGDYDADGRDELMAIAADGTLAVLDAENASGGSRRESELVTMDGALVRSGDLDVDCRLDVVAAAGSGVLVAASEDGASPAPVGIAPSDVAIGRVARTAPIRLVVAGGAGLSLVAPPGTTGVTTMLSPLPFAHVVAWDADGDGGTEIVATGTMGLLAFETAAGMERPMMMIPPSISVLHGPLAIGDVDDDGDIDLVVADAATIHIATRAGGLFHDASGASITMLDSAVVRVEAIDVDGDCADDVVAISQSGAVSVYRFTSATGGLTRIGMQSAALDFAVGDVDGDGAREIALLGPGGRVTLWQP